MRTETMIVCVSLVLVGGLAGIAHALSYDDMDIPVALSQNPTPFLLHCGIPDEFDPVHTGSASASEGQSVPVVPDTEQDQASSSASVGQHAATVAAIPEPSTLVVLGVGLTGLILVIRRRT